MPDAKIVKDAEKQIERIEEILEAQRKANIERSRRYAEFAVLIAKVWEAFEKKPAGEEINGFHTFKELVNHLSCKFGLHERQIHKYRISALLLVGQISQSQFENLGIEKANQLARIEKFRPGYVKRPGLVEHVGSIPVDELECKVDGLLSGHAELFESGAWDRLVIKGPREYISCINEGIRLARLQLGDIPTDAEVVWNMMVNQVQELQAEEEHARRKIAGEVHQ